MKRNFFIKLFYKMEFQTGSLTIIIGPMFSSKTTSLNNILTEFSDIGFSVMKIIHADDNRLQNKDSERSGSTHSSTYKTLSSKIHCLKTKNLKEVDVDDYDLIGIDEAQFFDDLLETVEFWVEKKRKHVKIAGLDGDFQKKKFGQVLDLIPLCDEVIKLTSKCQICIDNNIKNGTIRKINDINLAPFTKRLSDSLEQKDVGGKDKYIPTCRFHHQNQN